MAAMESKHALRAFDALSHHARLEIFRLLIIRGKAGLTARDLCEKMTMPPPTLSFHMSKLLTADLVGNRKSGRYVTYFAHYERVDRLINFLLENCCEGEEGTDRPVKKTVDLLHN